MMVRAKLACRIAMIDPDRVNEAIARGDYRCAPGTERGSARLFNERQVLVLMIYGRLLHFGLSPATAGEWACAFDLGLRKSPDAERIALEFEETGITDMGDADDPEIGDELATFRFDIGALRKRMKAELAKEQQILGRDDEGAE